MITGEWELLLGHVITVTQTKPAKSGCRVWDSMTQKEAEFVTEGDVTGTGQEETVFVTEGAVIGTGGG